MPHMNSLTQRLSLLHPIIQAPLAGGADTPALVAAVSEAGGIGCIGLAYTAPAQIGEVARAVRARTARPFGVNLFAPQPLPTASVDVAPALARVAPFYAELGLPPPEPPKAQPLPFEAQLEAALATDAALFSFTFGLLPAEAIAAIKARGLFLMGTATTVAEAKALAAAGVDAVVAQGAEAGGHRGTFLGDFAAAMIGTMALVPQIADAVPVPVVGSGGIMDGRGIAAALALGASAVQMGTAFLTCEEAGVPPSYRERILAGTEDETRLTRAFSGRLARGLRNRFMTEVEGGEAAAILPFPLQNALTRPLRAAAAQQDRADYLSLWAGQGVGLARCLPAGELVTRLAEETEAALRRLR